MLKQIHNAGVDLVRTVSIFTLSSMAIFLMENILYGNLHLNNKENDVI